MKTTSIVLVFIFSLLNSTVHGGETDNFQAMHEAILDSGRIFNTYLNNSIKNALLKKRMKHGIKIESCQQAALRVMKYLGSNNIFGTPALNTRMELWAESNEQIDRYPRYRSDKKLNHSELERYANNSIYSPGIRFLNIFPATLDPTININGVHFGTDKLSHFLGSGYLYYKKYLQIHKQSLSERQKHIFLIRKYGVANENGFIGKKAVGVFSYADLEANYQGFMLALDLCSTDDPVLYLSGEEWRAKKVSMAKYVNPNWDESFNQSTYVPSRWKSVTRNLERLDYCQKLMTTHPVQMNTHHHYLKQGYQSPEGIITSFSSKILKAAQHPPERLPAHQPDPYFPVTTADVKSLLSDIEKPLGQQSKYSIYTFCHNRNSDKFRWHLQSCQHVQ